MIRRVLALRPRFADETSAPTAAGAVVADADSAASVARPPIEPVPPSPTGRWDATRAYAYCERLARRHDQNFPVASRFVPEPLRRHVWAIYAFARAADDFADEPRYAGRRTEALDHWEEQLERACYGEAEHPIFIALRETLERCDIPISPLRDLLTAFRMDLTTRRYPTFEALRGYLLYSAVPVGQLLLYIFDYRDPSLHRYADDISGALELAHFLQDLPLDLRRDRLYLPEEDLRHFGLDVDDLHAAAEGEPLPRALRDLMRFQTARARALFQRGRPLTALVGRDLGFELNLIWHGGMAILDRIDALDGDVFAERPSLSMLDKARMVVRSAARRWPGPGFDRFGW